MPNLTYLHNFTETVSVTYEEKDLVQCQVIWNCALVTYGRWQQKKLRNVKISSAKIRFFIFMIWYYRALSMVYSTFSLYTEMILHRCSCKCVFSPLITPSYSVKKSQFIDFHHRIRHKRYSHSGRWMVASVYPFLTDHQ